MSKNKSKKHISFLKEFPLKTKGMSELVKKAERAYQKHRNRSTRNKK